MFFLNMMQVAVTYLRVFEGPGDTINFPLALMNSDSFSLNIFLYPLMLLLPQIQADVEDPSGIGQFSVQGYMPLCHEVHLGEGHPS